MNRYLNGMLTNEEVIQELLNLAKQIAAAQKEGDQLGLTADELAFYDALTKPQAIKDFYENEDGMDDAVQTVMTQCELWTDNADMEQREDKVVNYSFWPGQNLSMVAEDFLPYGKKD